MSDPAPPMTRTLRPPNPFIIYRSDKNQQIKSTSTVINQNSVFKVAADMWSEEDPLVRAAYERRAKAKAAEHKVMYPDYKYKPVRAPKGAEGQKPKKYRGKARVKVPVESRVDEGMQPLAHGSGSGSDSLAAPAPLLWRDASFLSPHADILGGSSTRDMPALSPPSAHTSPAPAHSPSSGPIMSLMQQPQVSSSLSNEYTGTGITHQPVSAPLHGYYGHEAPLKWPSIPEYMVDSPQNTPLLDIELWLSDEALDRLYDGGPHNYYDNTPDFIRY